MSRLRANNAKPTVAAPDHDRPKLGHVGIVAAVCFLIGIMWPMLAGVKLVPEPPGKEARQESEAPKAKPKPRRNPDDGPPQDIPVMQVAPQPKALAEASATVEESLVVNCRDGQGRRLNPCDKPAFDDIATDRLKALVQCEAAKNPDGVLSIGFDLDFENRKIQRILRGKSTSLDDATADALLDCARQEFMAASLDDLAHSHAGYLIFYMVRFAPPGVPVEPGEQKDPLIEASGNATVIWNSARLRATPEDGEIKATLMYGTKVVVTARQGDWYKVKYDAKGSEAWVHKNALAM